MALIGLNWMVIGLHVKKENTQIPGIIQDRVVVSHEYEHVIYYFSVSLSISD